MYGHIYYEHTDDPNKRLAHPHYNCIKFTAAQGGLWIYGSDQGAQGAYADRLQQLDYARDRAASIIVDREFDRDNARSVERYLSLFHNRPMTLQGVLPGVKPNGYPWYWYKWDWAGDALSPEDQALMAAEMATAVEQD